jgi:MFS family permease
MTLWLSAIASPQQRGRLIGGLTASMFLGQFLAPFVAYLILSAAPSQGAVFEVMGYAAALISLASAAWAIARRHRQHQPAT